MDRVIAAKSRRKELLLSGQNRFQRLGQLIRAGSGFETAADSLEPPNGVLRPHSRDQAGNPLQISVASARKAHGTDDIAVHFNVDCRGTGSLCPIGHDIFLLCFRFLRCPVMLSIITAFDGKGKVKMEIGRRAILILYRMLSRGRGDGKAVISGLKLQGNFATLKAA